jgi:hypothetical protein
MKLEKVSVVAAAGWVLTGAALIPFVHPASPASWTLLIGVGVIPPCMLLWLWRRPARTTSESIREAIK